MTDRRTFDAHVALFHEYATRVAQLPPAAWERITQRCCRLSDPSFRALLDRAAVAAKPYELVLPDGVPRRLSLRALTAISRGVQFGIALTTEIIAEFAAVGGEAAAMRGPQTTSTGSKPMDAYVEGTWLLEAALVPFARSQSGVSTAVRAAGQAVLRHDWITPAAFGATYQFMESEIPFAELESPPDRPAK